MQLNQTLNFALLDYQSAEVNVNRALDRAFLMEDQDRQMNSGQKSDAGMIEKLQVKIMEL